MVSYIVALVRDGHDMGLQLMLCGHVGKMFFSELELPDFVLEGMVATFYQ